jgi:hypothetical protein
VCVVVSGGRSSVDDYVPINIQRHDGVDKAWKRNTSRNQHYLSKFSRLGLFVRKKKIKTTLKVYYMLDDITLKNDKRTINWNIEISVY